MSDHPSDTEPTSAPPPQGEGASSPSDAARSEAIAAIYGPATPLAPTPEGRRRGWRKRKAAPSGGAGNGHRPDLVVLDGGGDDAQGPGRRPKIKWFRLAFLVAGLGILAIVSTVFGMMMAVASDLPEI